MKTEPIWCERCRMHIGKWKIPRWGKTHYHLYDYRSEAFLSGEGKQFFLCSDCVGRYKAEIYKKE